MSGVYKKVIHVTFQWTPDVKVLIIAASAQPTLTCSKSTVETPEKVVKYFQN